MTKLNLLGAQRVKALTEILERKFSDKIREVEKERIGREEAVRILAEKRGVTRLLDEIQEHESALNALKSDALDKLGVGIECNVDYYTFRISDETRKELNEVSENGVDGRTAKLRRELEDRKSQLWLVETLEEAQKIVNSEIEEE